MKRTRSTAQIRMAAWFGVVLAVAMLAGVARASKDHSTQVAVIGKLHATPDAVPDATLCNSQTGKYALGLADVPESGKSTFTGTFTGTGVFCGHTTAEVGPDGSVPFVETDTFTGTVHGCGMGSVTYHVQGFVSSRFDPATQGLPTSEDWQIVAHSGTGGLRGLGSGRGHDNGQINADSSIDTEFTGSVTCDSSAERTPTLPRARDGSLQVHAFNTDDQGIAPDGVSCSVSEGGCRGRVVGKTVWTGDLQGTATYVLNITPHPDGTASYEGTESMTVVVRGCGRGTFDLHITDGSYDAKRNLDSPGMPIADTDRWNIVPGSGTGALAQLRGHGVETITEFNNGKTKSDLTGSVTC